MHSFTVSMVCRLLLIIESHSENRNEFEESVAVPAALCFSVE